VLSSGCQWCEVGIVPNCPKFVPRLSDFGQSASTLKNSPSMAKCPPAPPGAESKDVSPLTEKPATEQTSKPAGLLHPSPSCGILWPHTSSTLHQRGPLRHISSKLLLTFAFLLCTVFTLAPFLTNAHSGGLAADGCHLKHSTGFAPLLPKSGRGGFHPGKSPAHREKHWISAKRLVLRVPCRLTGRNSDWWCFGWCHGEYSLSCCH